MRFSYDKEVCIEMKKTESLPPGIRCSVVSGTRPAHKQMPVFPNGLCLQGAIMRKPIHIQPWVPMMGATMAFSPSSALELEGVIKVQRDRDTEVHRHVLDVLGPVCGMGS